MSYSPMNPAGKTVPPGTDFWVETAASCVGLVHAVAGIIVCQRLDREGAIRWPHREAVRVAIGEEHDDVQGARLVNGFNLLVGQLRPCADPVLPPHWSVPSVVSRVGFWVLKFRVGA